MSTKKSKLDEMGKSSTFKVPEGYFEHFTEEMMSRLPERVLEEHKELNIWERVRPWVYMAAMFIGIALMINILVVSPDNKTAYQNKVNSGITIDSPADLDELYNFYEDQLASSVYRETLYLELSSSENMDY